MLKFLLQSYGYSFEGHLLKSSKIRPFSCYFLPKYVPEHKISVQNLKKRYNFTFTSHDSPYCVAYVPIGECLHLHVHAIASTCMCNCIYMYMQTPHAVVQSKKAAKMTSSVPVHAPTQAYGKARPCREAQAGSFLISYILYSLISPALYFASSIRAHHPPLRAMWMGRTVWLSTLFSLRR